jgi:hypothetical protein
MFVTLAWEIFRLCRDIHDARVALGIDELDDALQIILHGSGTANGAGGWRALRAWAGMIGGGNFSSRKQNIGG